MWIVAISAVILITWGVVRLAKWIVYHIGMGIRAWARAEQSDQGPPLQQPQPALGRPSAGGYATRSQTTYTDAGVRYRNN